MKVDKEIRILAQLLEVKTELQEQALSRKGGKKMDKEKCYKIIENCKEEVDEIIKECDGYDGNSIFLALDIIRDFDRLKKCISIGK